MRIAIITDAWRPQVNGVVRTLVAVIAELEARGDQVLVIAPDAYPSLPCPTYPEIRLAFTSAAAIGRRLEQFGADAIHLATEGPLCLAARRWCQFHALPFTTAYHTQFPEYVAARTGLPPELVWRYICWFHGAGEAVLASTPSIEAALRAHGLLAVKRWSRGVDTALFTPDGPRHPQLAALPGPVQLYVGRVAVEKNLSAFLAADTPGSKVVIGDGPARAALQQRFPRAHFFGAKFGAELASAYRAADVFVFPSLTDTFGLVMIEALACGTPVAAHPVTGPIDVVAPHVGALDEELPGAIAAALACDRAACAGYGAGFTWAASAAQFRTALVPVAREMSLAA